MTQSRIILPERAIATPHTQGEFLLGLQTGIPVPREAAVEFRLLGSGDKSIRRSWGTFTNSTPQSLLLPTFPTDRNVFYGVALRKQIGDHAGVGSAANCHDSHLLCVDLDLKTAQLFGSRGEAVLSMSPEELRAQANQLAQAALTRSRELNIEPRALLYSGHGVQLIWALPAPIPHKKRERFNREVCELFGPALGADLKVGNAAQIMRLPSTPNLKNPDRPLFTELWGMAPDAQVEPRVLGALTSAPSVNLNVGRTNDQTIQDRFNHRYPHPRFIEQCGYKRVSDDRYTRPGDGASGGDVRLLRNARGILCSYHHSSNDPVMGTPGDSQLRTPFDLLRDLHHGGDHKSAVREAIRLLGVEENHNPTGPVDDQNDGEGRTEKRSAATRVVGYTIEAGAEPWHDQNGDAYISVQVKDHCQHHRLPSRGIQDHLQLLFYRREGRSLSSPSLQEAMSLLGTMARVDGPQCVTGLRTCHHDGHTYIDLGDSSWQVVVVEPGSWRVIPAVECPVRFTRPHHMWALPVPLPGGSLTVLQQFLSVDTASFMMCVAWLLAAISGMRPYPLLAVSGVQGHGKSSAMSTLQRLVDPHQADRRKAPRDERDLFITAKNAHVIAYDNISVISPWLSDGLCVLSTGGAFTTRTLFSDDEETVLEAARPVIINGIDDLLARADLADRALTIMVQPIDERSRMTELELWTSYAEARPQLLGALLTALAGALERLPTTTLTSSPRLADFARLIVAAEPGLPWQPGEFLRAYTRMQTEAAEILLDGEVITEAIQAFIDEVGTWTGLVGELLKILTARLPQPARPPKEWPQNPKALGVQLRRLAIALSRTGYLVTPAPVRNNRGRMYHLQKTGKATYTKSTDTNFDVHDTKF